MSVASIDFQTLLAYNHADAERWHAYFVQHPGALDIEVGGRTPKIRNLVAHIFEVESFFASDLDSPGAANYVQLNPESLDEMYEKHEEAHGLVTRFVESATEEDMQKMHSFPRRPEYKFSSRKLLAQFVWHGINHWGQIAMLVRRGGFETGPPHDIIVSSVLQ
jgi:uncharacterized damage-inducible protein DinB